MMAVPQTMPESSAAVKHPAAGVPNGFRWALIPEEPIAGGRRHGEMIRYDDPKSRKIKEFKYERLTNMKKRIRLLVLMAGKQENSEVECQLFEGEIKKGKVWRIKDDVHQTEVQVKYEALSWSWGIGLPEYQVLIRKEGKRRRKKTSKELVWALRYLRYQDKDRILWIDAICINQESVDEKNHQVQMMSQIYSYAERVCIWLGLDDKESSRAIDFIKNEILQLEHFDALCTDENNSEKWQSLLLLMQRQWFFRRWVVQEIALAKDAIIYCGPDNISWNDFSVAVELFVEVETATHRLSEVMKKDPRFYHVPGWFEYVSALAASLLVEATGMIFRYYKPEKASKPISDLEINRVNGEDNKSQANHTSERDLSNNATNGEVYERNREETENTEDEDTEQSDADIGSDKDSESGSEREDKNESKAERHSEHQDGESHDKSPKTLSEAPLDDPISQRRPLLSLEYLVSKLSIFEATEPRDAIYSMLAIANDGYPYAEGSNDELSQSTQKILAELSGEQKPFPVNYGRAYGDVCQDFIEFCIARSDKTRALDIICRPWAPDPNSGTSIHFTPKPKSDDIKNYLKLLKNFHIKNPRWSNWELIRKHFPERKGKKKDPPLPSWIPRLEGAPFAMYSQAGVHIMKMGRKNADPLVGLPHGSRNYDAAQSTTVDETSLNFRKRRLQNAHCMFVKGFILETVETTTDSAQSGNIPGDWLKLGNWKILKNPEKETGPPEEFWRTIVADRGRDGRNPPYYYSRACKESVYKGGLVSGAVNTSDLINNERNSIVAQFCRRVQAVIWNRSVIKTDQGNLGVASKEVKKGDLVCILYGCSVPVILRRKLKSPKRIEQEEEYDRVFGKLESILQRYMSTAKGIKNRKERWEALPEKATGEFKWGKEDVRSWLAEYKALAKKLPEKKDDVDGSAATRSNYQRKAKKRDDCYYEFLGECYIHGMMDGEAMRRKIKHETQCIDDWAREKPEAIRRKLDEYKLKPSDEKARSEIAEAKRVSTEPLNRENSGLEIDDGEKPLSDEGETDEEAAKKEKTEKAAAEKATTEETALEKTAAEKAEAEKAEREQAEEEAWDEWRNESLLDTIFELR